MFQIFQVTLISNRSTNLIICYKFNVNQSVEMNSFKSAYLWNERESEAS